MALAHFLVFNAKNAQQIVLAHINYHLRGAASDEDALLVAESSRLWNCQFVQLDVYYDSAQGNLQAWARRARLDFFERTRSERNSEYIALAHHQSDLVETTFLQLIRGAGWDGLVNMILTERPLIRPFLNVPKADIMEYINRMRIPFRIDHTNLELKYRRNRIRHEILPLLETYHPEALNHLSRGLELAGNAIRFCRHVIDDELNMFCMETGVRFHRYDAAILRRIPTELQTAMWRSMILRFDPDFSSFSYSSLNHLNDLIKSKLTVACFFQRKIQIQKNRHEIILCFPAQPCETNVPSPGAYHCGNIRLNLQAAVGVINEGGYRVLTGCPDGFYLDADRINWPLRLTNQYQHLLIHTGDFSTAKKMGEHLRDNGIPALVKQHLYYLCDKRQVVCYERGVSHFFYKIRPNTTNILKITFNEE